MTLLIGAAIWIVFIPIFYLVYMKVMCRRLKRDSNRYTNEQLQHWNAWVLPMVCLWPCVPAMYFGMYFGICLADWLERMAPIKITAAFYKYIAKKIKECAIK